MATSARLRDIAQNHKLRVWLTAAVVLLIIFAIVIGVLLLTRPHHHQKTVPTVTVTLTSLTATMFSPTATASWAFTVRFSDPTHIKNPLTVTPLYASPNTTGGPSTYPAVGTMLMLHADHRNSVYSGALDLEAVIPEDGGRILADQAHGLVKAVVSVGAFMDDDRLLEWLCSADLTFSASGSASTSGPIKCTLLAFY